MADAKRGAAALDELAAAREKKGRAKAQGARDDTHEDLACELLQALADETGAPPVFAEGELWVAEGSTWRPKHVREVRNRIARRFNGRKHADTQRGIAQVADRVFDRAFAPDFFAEAPVGVATPTSFWALRDGALTSAPRSYEQRQRFELPVDPAFDDERERVPRRAPLWEKFLAATFKGRECAAQIAAMQEVYGACLFGLLAEFQKVVLWVGVTRSGKGTAARVLEALFPPVAVCSVSPDRWGHEYHRAALAGARLNLVGEVDESRPIPAGDFKAITGRDLIGARNPNHAAFTFRCDAAHVFSGNAFPAARDRDNAFYGRWQVIEFRNSVAGHEDPELAGRLVRDELPGILAWALVGAERLAARGRFASTKTHATLLERWRIDHSSVLTWLKDADAVELERSSQVSRTDAFEAFRHWARANGRAPLSAHTFYEELRRSASPWGVREARDKNGRYIRGIKLKPFAG